MADVRGMSLIDRRQAEKAIMVEVRRINTGQTITGDVMRSAARTLKLEHVLAGMTRR